MDLSLVISIGALVFCCIIIALLLQNKRKLNARLSALELQIESSSFLLNELNVSSEKHQATVADKEAELATWQLEHQQVSQQLEHRIKVLQENLHSVSEQLEQLQSQQPEDKLYRRAKKMIALGAGVDEVAQECGLPIAEAEILATMHGKKIQ